MWALLSVYIDKCLEAKNGKFFYVGLVKSQNPKIKI
jgi:hypothetical protein